MDIETAEPTGKPPEWVFNPRAGEEGLAAQGSAIITARFFMDSDPRPDGFGNTVINENGSVPTLEMVEITNLNDQKSGKMIAVAHDIHRYRLFPKEYQAFRAGRDVEATGFPLREWIGENDRTRNIAHFHIYTVEQLAAASDSLCQTLGPGTYDLRTKARAFLESRKNSGFAEQVAQENAALKQQMADMQAQMARVTAMVDASQRVQHPQEIELHPSEILDETPVRRGRPRANAGA